MVDYCDLRNTEHVTGLIQVILSFQLPVCAESMMSLQNLRAPKKSQEIFGLPQNI